MSLIKYCSLMYQILFIILVTSRFRTKVINTRPPPLRTPSTISHVISSRIDLHVTWLPLSLSKHERLCRPFCRKEKDIESDEVRLPNSSSSDLGTNIPSCSVLVLSVLVLKHPLFSPFFFFFFGFPDHYSSYYFSKTCTLPDYAAIKKIKCHV